MISKQHTIGTPLPTAPFVGNPLLKEDTETFTNDPEDKSYFVMDRKLIAAHSPEYLELDTTEIGGNRIFYISVDGSTILDTSGYEARGCILIVGSRGYAEQRFVDLIISDIR